MPAFAAPVAGALWSAVYAGKALAPALFYGQGTYGQGIYGGSALSGPALLSGSASVEETAAGTIIASGVSGHTILSGTATVEETAAGVVTGGRPHLTTVLSGAAAADITGAGALIVIAYGPGFRQWAITVTTWTQYAASVEA